jgi:hypothetical protein
LGSFAAFVIALSLLGAGCDGESGDGGTGIPVTFTGIIANGTAFSITTTALTLTFSGEIDGLSARISTNKCRALR